MAVRDALIGFMAATAQAQAEATKEAQRAGIAAQKGDPMKYRGRKPSFDQATLDAVVGMLSLGLGTSEIARENNVTRQTVLRIKAEPIAAQEALDRWAASH